MSWEKLFGEGNLPVATALPLRVALVTDDRLFADGIVRLFDAEPSFAIEWSGVTGDSAIDSADVILLDSRTEGALVCCRDLTRERRAPVILVAAPDDDAWTAEAIAAGARGILKRSAGADDMFCAVRAVSGGVIWAPRRVISAMIDRLSRDSDPTSAGWMLLEQRLSTRERDIFHHAVRGLGNKELAVRLAISEATVKVHLTHIFQKLGVRGRSELAAVYYGIALPARDAEIGPPISLTATSRASVPSSAANAIIRKL